MKRLWIGLMVFLSVTLAGCEKEKVGEDDYGQRIIKYLEGRGIRWLCWVFDPEWHPRMLESWESYELTGGRKYFPNRYLAVSVSKSSAFVN